MINGVINIKKERGYTSHDVVAKLRGILKQKKIGHTGTLDPDATGVLPVCLGKATKLCDMLTEKDKTYETELLLGMETDTQDITGKVMKEGDWTKLTKEVVTECIKGFLGESDQIPPMYSALKVNGKKLYELAREGKVIERQPRKIQISEIEILEVDLPVVKIRITCSKGTYIRTICHDIGEKLQCCGCMKSLTRTRVSQFLIENSFTLKEVQQMRDENCLEKAIIPLDEMWPEYKVYILPKSQDRFGINGNNITCEKIKTEVLWQQDESIRVYGSELDFIGIYKYDKESAILKIEKMFYDPEEKKE